MLTNRPGNNEWFWKYQKQRKADRDYQIYSVPLEQIRERVEWVQAESLFWSLYAETGDGRKTPVLVHPQLKNIATRLIALRRRRKPSHEGYAQVFREMREFLEAMKTSGVDVPGSGNG